MFKIAGSDCCLGDMKFYDVFWRTSDLLPFEIANYERKKKENIFNLKGNCVLRTLSVRKFLCIRRFFSIFCKKGNDK